jgi:hypothetical protein
MERSKDKLPNVYSIPAVGGQFGLNGFYRTTLEMGRLKVLADMEAMLSTFMFGPANAYATWLASEMPSIRFDGGNAARAEGIAQDLLYRIRYEKHRKQILFNAIFKEEFLLLEIEWNPELQSYLAQWQQGGEEGDKAIESFARAINEGAGMGSIAGIKHLPARFTFKWFDALDRPISTRKAFFQLEDPMLAGVAPFDGREAPPARARFIPYIAMIHPRFQNWMWDNVWYSRPAMLSMREQFNRVQLMLEDSALDSHYSMTPVLVFYINAMGKELGANDEQIKKFQQGILGERNEKWEQVVSAGSMVFLSGTDKVEMVNDGRLYSIRGADLQLQLDLLMMNSPFPAALMGFGNGKGMPSGDALDQLKKQAEMAIREGATFEWEEILRPLIERELILNGVAGVRMTPKYPQTSFDSRTVQEKIDESQIGSFRKSRKAAFTGKDEDTWEEAQQQIIREHREFKDAGMDIIPYREDAAQDVDKGTQGKTGDGKVEPVQKKAGASGDRKTRKNFEGGE